MNLETILIPLLISFLISVLFWAMVYLIPSLFPQEMANFSLYFQKSKIKDPIEIGLLTNQFIKNDNWQKIRAMKLLEAIFKNKIAQLESKKYDKWQSELKIQKELLEHRNFSEDEILHLETATEIKNKYGEKIKSLGLPPSSYYLNSYEEEFIEIRKEKLKEISHFSDHYKNLKFWALKNRNLMKFIQERVFNNEPLNLEKITSSNEEWALINIWGMFPPEKYDENIFKDLILFIDIHSMDKNGEKLLKEFNIALSNHKKSLIYLEKLINEMDSSYIY